MQVDNIRLFLGTCSLEELCNLKAHCESGRLSVYSCCCLIGVRTAPHPLKSAGEYDICGHYAESRNYPYAEAAEREFYDLGADEHGGSDSLRRERLLPLVLEEIAFRDRLAEQLLTPEYA